MPGVTLVRLALVAIFLSLTLTVSLARAWWVIGHGRIAAAACAILPDDVPAFFRAASKQLADHAAEPDRWKNAETRDLGPATAPDHYLDLENFGDNKLPTNRYEAIALLISLKKPPEKTGMLPYAIMENYDRLTVAFFDYRQAKNKGDDEARRAAEARCLVYAGILAHFTGDCAMPLHTTVNYDGRKQPDRSVLQKGIHARLDAFPEKHDLMSEEMAKGLQAKVTTEEWETVEKALHDSFAQIDRAYELDKADAFTTPTKDSRDYVLERCRAATQLTADLWLTAWRRSEKLKSPF